MNRHLRLLITGCLILLAAAQTLVLARESAESIGYRGIPSLWRSSLLESPRAETLWRPANLGIPIGGASSPVANCPIFGMLQLRTLDGEDKDRFIISSTGNLAAFSLFKDLNYYSASAGDVATDGKYYYMEVEYGAGGAFPRGLYTLDLKTAERSHLVTYTMENGYYFIDMTYCEGDRTMYALAEDGEGTALFVVDLQNGQFRNRGYISKHNVFVGLTDDADGALLLMRTDGHLCRMPKPSEPSDLVDLGSVSSMVLQGAQSLAYDKVSGKVFWAMNQANTSRLMQIDLTDLSVEHIGSLPGFFVGLCVSMEQAPPTTPGAVGDLYAVPDAQGGFSAALRWKNPTHTVEGNLLTGTLSLEIYRNNVPVHTMPSVEPGAILSWMDDGGVKESGTYHYKIIARNAAGSGLPAHVIAMIGKDVPAAPHDLILTQEGSAISLSWRAPTTGLRNGYIDTDQTRYDVRRLPDGRLMASGLQSTVFVDRTISEYQSWSYTIVAKNDQGEGGKAASEPIMFGAAKGLPFVCEFTEPDFKQWTVIDGNPMPGEYTYTWKHASAWGEGNGAGCSYAPGSERRSDDWLISPPLAVSSQDLIWTFDAKSRADSYPEDMEIYYGNDPDPKKMTLLDRFEIKTMASDSPLFQWKKCEYRIPKGTFSAAKPLYLAFHSISGQKGLIVVIKKMMLKPDYKGGAEVLVTLDRNGVLIPFGGANVRLISQGNEGIEIKGKTGDNGVCRFEAVAPGRYTAAVDIYRHSQPTQDVVISNTGFVPIELRVKKLDEISVKGSIRDARSNPLNGLGIKVSGYNSGWANLSPGGQYHFPYIYSTQGKKDTIIVTGTWRYKSAQREVAFAATDLTGIDFNIEDKPVPVLYAQASAGETLVVSWLLPNEIKEYSKDDGHPEGRVSFGVTGTARSIAGMVYRKPQVITSLRWFPLDESAGIGAHYVNLFLFELDEQGDPSSKIIYEKHAVPSEQGKWNTLPLESPVTAPHGYMIAISADEGNIQLGVAGESPKRTSVVSIDYRADKPKYSESFLDEGEAPRAYMLRTEGTDLEQATLINPSFDFLSYRVYRLLAGEETDPSRWTILTSESINSRTFTDAGYSALPQGYYRYAVRADYGHGVLAPAVLTATIAHDMVARLDLSLAYKSPAQPEDKVFVSLESNGSTPATYSRHVRVSESLVSFPQLPKGQYALTVEARGFAAYHKVLDITDTETSISVEMSEEVLAVDSIRLIERIDDPSTLVWSEGGFLDDFEGHTDFAINSPGRYGWSYIDADGAKTSRTGPAPYPNMRTQKAFMIFNPTNMDPALDKALPTHSGERVLMAASSVGKANDDWIISPRLRFTEPFVFQFVAKSLDVEKGEETFQVGYSLFSADPQAFIWVEQGKTVGNQGWSSFRYELPAATRYVALRLISDQKGFFFADDLFVGHEKGSEAYLSSAITAVKLGMPIGYDVYVDDQLIAKNVQARYCTLPKLAKGKHTFGVVAIYAAGRSPRYERSIEVTGTVSTQGASAAQHSPYPNPANTVVHLGGLASDVRLYALNGSLAKEERTADCLDVSVLPAGMYIIVYHVDGQRVQAKIEVKH